MTDVSEVLTASVIIRVMMEAVRYCETSVSIYQTTQCYIPKDSHLHDVIIFVFPQKSAIKRASSVPRRGIFSATKSVPSTPGE
jgi:hypothetical protein